MGDAMPDRYSIGSLKADLRDGTVSDEVGVVTQLRPKTAQVFRLLLDKSGELVSRDDLINTVWPDTHVVENSLSQCIVEIRRALGASQGLLRTLPRRGFVLDGVKNADEFGSDADRQGTIEVRDRALIGTPTVAVLPFHHERAQPLLTRMANVLMDALVSALVTSREPVVISASSTRVAFAQTADLSELSRRLGANYLVGGVLYNQDDSVNISIELSEGPTGAVVGQRGFASTEQALLQDSAGIAAHIAHALIPRLREAELRRARTARAHKLSAYHLMLEAQVLMARLDANSFDKAHQKLLNAAEVDPGFAPARQQLANWYSLRIGQRWSTDPQSDTRALIAEAETAIEMDASNGRALALLGHSHAILKRDYDQAQELLGRALAECPNDAEARMWATPTLAYVGRLDEAVANAEYAIRLSPEDPLMYRYEHFSSIAHYCSKNYAEASRFGLRSMRRNKNYSSNLLITAAALAALGKLPESHLVAEVFLGLHPQRSVSDVMARAGLIDPATREEYAQHLVAAGIPP